MTAAGLARLLARLDADVERAAAEYERLHRALVRFFDWRGAWSPEECADEALDRLANRLEGDTNVESVRSYVYGIARLVLLEHQRALMTSPPTCVSGSELVVPSHRDSVAVRLMPLTVPPFLMDELISGV